MTPGKGNIAYIDDPLTLGTAGSTVLAIIPEVTSKDELFSELERQLRFPEWGRNWDALFDWLSRLHWLPETSVLIVHDGLPLLSEPDLRTYLSMLRDVNATWESRPEHKLISVFPRAAASRIKRLEAGTP